MAYLLSLTKLNFDYYLSIYHYTLQFNPFWNILPEDQISLNFDTLRLPQAELDYRYPKYHNFSIRSFVTTSS